MILPFTLSHTSFLSFRASTYLPLFTFLIFFISSLSHSLLANSSHLALIRYAISLSLSLPHPPHSTNLYLFLALTHTHRKRITNTLSPSPLDHASVTNSVPTKPRLPFPFSVVKLSLTPPQFLFGTIVLIWLCLNIFSFLAIFFLFRKCYSKRL